jgi:hypothetical protein
MKDKKREQLPVLIYNDNKNESKYESKIKRGEDLRETSVPTQKNRKRGEDLRETSVPTQKKRNKEEKTSEREKVCRHKREREKSVPTQKI